MSSNKFKTSFSDGLKINADFEKHYYLFILAQNWLSSEDCLNMYNNVVLLNSQVKVILEFI